MERYYQPEIECASREQIREWQSERLVKQVQNVWDNVPYYRKRMEDVGLEPGISNLLMTYISCRLLRRMTCATAIRMDCWRVR